MSRKTKLFAGAIVLVLAGAMIGFFVQAAFVLGML